MTTRRARFAWSAITLLLAGCSDGGRATPSNGAGGKSLVGASGAPGGGGAPGGAGFVASGGRDSGAPGTGGSSGGSGDGGSAGSGGAADASAGAPTSSDAGPSDADAGSAACARRVAGIEVADVDLDAFPPYAIDGCVLVYVGRDGALVRRDLGSGAETLLEPASAEPRRPALAGPVTAWEATSGGKSVVRVRVGTTTTTVVGSFDHAGEPKAAVEAVVFTGWLTAADDGDTDVFVWLPSESRSLLVLGGAGQQRFADVSATHFAISDFSEDPGGRYTGTGASLADVVLVARATGNPVKRPLPGKQAFPMLGSEGSLAYLEWAEVHPVPKFQDYTIRAVPLATPAAEAREIAHVTSLDAVRPTVAGGRAEWVSRSSTGSSLFQADFALDGAPVQVTLPGISTVHAPISAARLTILAVRPTFTSVPRLDSVAW